MGARSNIKITEPEDLELLNKFLTRSGTGFDLHKYEAGNGIILGGYKMKCDYKIVTHSDGDVLLHSIADSILGAAGLGDIGKFFPEDFADCFPLADVTNRRACTVCVDVRHRIVQAGKGQLHAPHSAFGGWLYHIVPV